MVGRRSLYLYAILELGDLLTLLIDDLLEAPGLHFEDSIDLVLYHLAAFGAFEAFLIFRLLTRCKIILTFSACFIDLGFFIV